MGLDSLNRHRERGLTDRTALNALLDEVLVGTLSTVATDGSPWAVPLLFARHGDDVVLHGSTGAGALRNVAAGAEMTFTVFSVDALVLAHSTFDHSANYRSAMIRGVPRELTGEAKVEALDRLSDRIVPGRVAEVRAMTSKEVAATSVLALEIGADNWLLKARAAGPSDSEEQHDVWRGIIPVQTSYGVPQPSPDSLDRPLPGSVRRLLGE